MDIENKPTVEELLLSLKSVFIDKDTALFQSLFHKGHKEVDIRSLVQLIDSFIFNNYIVKEYQINRYVEPKWEVFKEFSYYPNPVFGISLVLENDRSKTHDLFLAASKSNEGLYSLSYYVEK